MSGSNGNDNQKIDYPRQFAASVPMHDPGLRYQYAPPYSPQRTDPDWEKKWNQRPEYSPPQDDTLLGPFRMASAVSTDQPGPAAEIPHGPVQGQPTLLPQYSNLGQTRPFGPGEYLTLPNGSWASEMTYTLQIGDQWSVVPGLWLINGVPTHVTEDQAQELAQQSGLIWPTFSDEKTAEQYANQREAQWQKAPFGGSHTQQPLWSRQWPPAASTSGRGQQ